MPNEANAPVTQAKINKTFMTSRKGSPLSWQERLATRCDHTWMKLVYIHQMRNVLPWRQRPPWSKNTIMYIYKPLWIISLQQVDTHLHIHRNDIPRKCISFKNCESLWDYKRTNGALSSPMLLVKLSMTSWCVYVLFVTYCLNSLQWLAYVKGVPSISD